MNPKPKAKEELRLVPEIEEYETIMRSLQTGICRLDKIGTIIYANDTAAQMFGWEKNDLVGSRYFEVFFGPGAESRDPRCGPFEFTITDGEISHVNTEALVRKDGTEFLTELICVPINDGSGVDGAVVSLIDVTDQRHVEDAVSDAREQAVEAARSKADFLANMSHEIRTPLTGIIGTIDLLSGTKLDEDQREILTILLNSTELLRAIVNEILDYSKIEAGKFIIRDELFSLRKLIEVVVEPFRPLASEKKIDLTIDYEKGLPDFIECDSRSVQQVLNNLLSNALKFTEQGSVVLILRLCAGEDRLRFIVRDTGIGIPEGEREKLFAPFEQADASSARRFAGTGLGLAISRRLVVLMGGEIGFDSTEGAGTNFWFEIPFKPGSEAPEPIQQKVPIVSGEQKPRILVVDDNPVNLEVTKRLLEQIGVESASARNGDEAVKICGNQDFDIVLMDCQMPGMDGFEASRRIRQNGETPSIIAFTASVNENDREKLIYAGMNGILRKPFTQNDLIEIIESHFTSPKGNKTLDLSGYFVEHAISKFIEPKSMKQFASIDTDPRGFLREILGVFGDHFAEKLAVLETGISELDRQKIKSLAHNLKGSSANLGLTKLYGQLQTLEREAERSEGDRLRDLLYSITLEFGLIRDAIAELEEEEHLK